VLPGAQIIFICREPCKGWGVEALLILKSQDTNGHRPGNAPGQLSSGLLIQVIKTRS